MLSAKFILQTITIAMGILLVAWFFSSHSTPDLGARDFDFNQPAPIKPLPPRIIDANLPTQQEAAFLFALGQVATKNDPRAINGDFTPDGQLYGKYELPGDALRQFAKQLPIMPDSENSDFYIYDADSKKHNITEAVQDDCALGLLRELEKEMPEFNAFKLAHLWLPEKPLDFCDKVQTAYDEKMKLS